LADRFVTGTCPKCGNPEAYGDQCEKCGSTLNATDLINPKSTITGETPILKETKHWFLPLDLISRFFNQLDFRRS
jgi:methionyl-tRNA synthetase